MKCSKASIQLNPTTPLPILLLPSSGPKLGSRTKRNKRNRQQQLLLHPKATTSQMENAYTHSTHAHSQTTKKRTHRQKRQTR